MLKPCLVLSALIGGLFGALRPIDPADPCPSSVREAGFEWMIGNWSGTTDDGGTLVHSFAWDLDKHVIVHARQGRELEYLGVTALDSGSRGGQVRWVRQPGHGLEGRVEPGRRAWS